MSLYFLLIVPFILIVAGRKSDYSEKSEIMNAYIHRSNMKVLENIEWSIRQDELMTWNTRTFSQMKPYGMTLRENFDAHDDKLGALKTAPNTQIQGRLKENTYNSLRNGKKIVFDEDRKDENALRVIHLITGPFNIQAFNAHEMNIDIHKDGPTLLYCSG